MEKIIYNNCKALLENEPELRKVSKRLTAIWRYWQVYQSVGGIIEKTLFTDILASPETISRRIREVQNDFRELDDPENRIRKMELEFENVKEFSQNKLNLSLNV